MIAIDTSVLIDLLGDDEAMADAAEGCVREALARGPVVLCDVVVSEITAGLGHGADIMDVVEEMGMSFLPVERRSAIRAGEMQRRYNERRRKRGLAVASPRTVPDFIVGAHAMLQCSALITRDSGFFRDYFKGLKVIVPAVS
ncbi:type II toxin-antitoxin system VapC family toxin [Marilutibacter alkalisoli]|uniref:Type II toxin-antitoxin system VapC family toxin n=1 Tax=Marilutibacter alkalisoli TaxID=2591633 RepID=A0A514BSL1_9GAMM|nr:type II toxin-antitoxin system VapC family toxin [Lysobacter alkalisoli]QDH70009.1 type II toxin-antitoxin system VapC family toxin [Lysobacter alkalisoli]